MTDRYYLEDDFERESKMRASILECKLYFTVINYSTDYLAIVYNTVGKLTPERARKVVGLENCEDSTPIFASMEIINRNHNIYRLERSWMAIVAFNGCVLYCGKAKHKDIFIIDQISLTKLEKPSIFKRIKAGFRLLS